LFGGSDHEGEGSIHSHDDDEHLAPGVHPKLVKIYDISAHHLPRMDWLWGSKCDPFVLFDFDEKKSKTEVMKNTFDAKFTDEIFFDVENVEEVGDMSIIVKDWDLGSSDEVVGSAMLPKPDIREFLSLP
jgi:Ca2+-dependent lipid-binding protein